MGQGALHGARQEVGRLSILAHGNGGHLALGGEVNEDGCGTSKALDVLGKGRARHDFAARRAVGVPHGPHGGVVLLHAGALQRERCQHIGGHRGRLRRRGRCAGLGFGSDFVAQQMPRPSSGGAQHEANHEQREHLRERLQESVHPFSF